VITNILGLLIRGSQVQVLEGEQKNRSKCFGFYIYMNHLLYILHSPTKDKFYVGETEDFDKRLELHRSKQFTQSYTAKQADDWEVFLTVECQSRNHARKVEEFIKKMKSKKFIQSLKDDDGKLKSIVQRFLR
jgi:putative endonuclease